MKTSCGPCTALKSDLCCCCFIFKGLFIWKAEQQKKGRRGGEDREREWEWEIIFLLGHFQVTITIRSGPAQSQEPGTPSWSLTWVVWVICYCLPRHVIRKLDWKWSSWDSNKHPDMGCQVASSGLTDCTTMLAPDTANLRRKNIMGVQKIRKRWCSYHSSLQSEKYFLNLLRSCLFFFFVNKKGMKAQTGNLKSNCNYSCNQSLCMCHCRNLLSTTEFMPL